MITTDPRPHVRFSADEALIRALVAGALRPENAAQARQLGEALIAAADELDGLGGVDH